MRKHSLESAERILLLVKCVVRIYRYLFTRFANIILCTVLTFTNGRQPSTAVIDHVVCLPFVCFLQQKVTEHSDQSNLAKVLTAAHVQHCIRLTQRVHAIQPKKLRYYNDKTIQDYVERVF